MNTRRQHEKPAFPSARVANLIAMLAAVFLCSPLYGADATPLMKLLEGSESWKPAGDGAAKFAEAFHEACAKAGNDDMPGLVDVFERSLKTPAGKFADGIYNSIADVWTRAELERFAAEKPEPLAFEKSGRLSFYREPPVRKDLEAALLLRHNLRNLAHSSVKAEVSVDRKEAAFLADFVLLLREKLDKPVERFGRYDPAYNQWRGSPSTRLNRAHFMAALKERAIARACAIVMQDTETWAELKARKAPERDWRAEFLKLCGVDWERVYIGLLVREWVYREDRQAVSGLTFGTDPALQWLCASGSQAAIGQVLGVLDQSWCREQLIGSLAALVPPGKQGKPSTLLRRLLGEPLPAPFTDEILKTLCGGALVTSSELEARELVTELRRLRRAEGTAAVRTLVEHWADRIRKQAHETLVEFGENPPPLAPPAPVRFQLVVNGKPMHGASETLSQTMAASELGLATFDAAGIASMPREKFIRPGAANSPFVMSFRPGYFYPASGYWHDERFHKNAESLPFAAVKLEPPIRLDEINRVEISAAPLKINVFHPRGETALKDHDAQFIFFGKEDSGASAFKRAASRENVFPVQTGKYRVRIRLSGAAVWQSEEFEHGADGTSLAARPGIGSDVTFRISANGWPKASFMWQIEPEPRLDDVNDRMPDQKTGRITKRCIEPGDYKLIIPSHAEASRRMKGGGTNYMREPGDPKPYAGRTIDFTVRPDSPALLDLGDIKLDEEK